VRPKEGSYNNTYYSVEEPPYTQFDLSLTPYLHFLPPLNKKVQDATDNIREAFWPDVLIRDNDFMSLADWVVKQKGVDDFHHRKCPRRDNVGGFDKASDAIGIP
jgi:hypothetical protein